MKLNVRYLLILLILLFLLILLICIFKFKNKKKYKNKVNIINLETDKKRLTKIKSNFHKFNIKYNIIKAIDGSKYTLTQSDRKYLKNVDYDINVNKGTVGCNLSHIKLLEKFCHEKNKKYLIVAEDDIEIIDYNFNNIIESILTKKELYFDIIYLCSTKKSIPKTKLILSINDKYSLYDIKNKSHRQGTMLYIISLQGALHILSKYYNGMCKNAIDWFYINEMKQPLIIYPSLAIHSKNKSSIQNRNN